MRLFSVLCSSRVLQLLKWILGFSQGYFGLNIGVKSMFLWEYKGQDVKKLKPLYNVGGNVKLYKKWFLKNVKIELPYDPPIPLLIIYPKKLKSEY